VDIDIVGGQRLGHGAGMGYDELDWRFFSGCGINSLFSASCQSGSWRMEVCAEEVACAYVSEETQGNRCPAA
jgi:hypothetical protein